MSTDGFVCRHIPVRVAGHCFSGQVKTSLRLYGVLYYPRMKNFFALFSLDRSLCNIASVLLFFIARRVD